MFEIKQIEPKRTLTVQSDIEIPLQDIAVKALFEALDNFNVVEALDRFDFNRDTIDPTLYKYKFVTKDTRVWKQDIRVPASTEAEMTFSVNDYWKLSEFAPHRVIRDYAVSLAKNYQIITITGRWV